MEACPPSERHPRRTGETGPARPALDGSGTRFQAGLRVSASRPVSKRGSVTIPNKTRPIDAERRGGGNDAGGLSPRRTERREARDVGRGSPPAGASSSQTGTRRTRGLHVRPGAGRPSERSAWSPPVRSGAPRARLLGSSGHARRGPPCGALGVRRPCAQGPPCGALRVRRPGRRQPGLALRPSRACPLLGTAPHARPADESPANAPGPRTGAEPATEPTRRSQRGRGLNEAPTRAGSDRGGKRYLRVGQRLRQALRRETVVPSITFGLTEAGRPRDKPQWQIRTVRVKGPATSPSHRAQLWGGRASKHPAFTQMPTVLGALRPLPRVMANRRCPPLPLPFCPFLDASSTVPRNGQAPP